MTTRVTCLGRSLLSRLRRRVHRLTQLGAGRIQLLDCSLDLVVVVAFESALDLGDRLLDGLLDIVVDLVGVLAEQLLGTEDQVVGLVAELDSLATLGFIL